MTVRIALLILGGMPNVVSQIRDTRMKLIFVALFLLTVALAFLSVVFVFGFSMLGPVIR